MYNKGVNVWSLARAPEHVPYSRGKFIDLDKVAPKGTPLKKELKVMTDLSARFVCLRHRKPRPSLLNASASLRRRIAWDQLVEDIVVVFVIVVAVVVYLTLTDPLRMQPWSQDRWNQTKSNRSTFGERKKRKTDRRKRTKK